MIDLRYATWFINRIYRSRTDSIYAHRFYQDMSAGFYTLQGRKQTSSSLLSFNPKTCLIEGLIKKSRPYYYVHEIEQTLFSTLGHLIQYGKAYLYCNLKYCSFEEDNSLPKKKIESLDIKELIGCQSIQKNVFFEKGFNGRVKKTEINRDALVVLDLKDLGYKRNYFKKVVERLSKYDTISASQLLLESIDEYNFMVHNTKNQKELLKATRDIGWYFYAEGMSESYLLYRKIQLDKLKRQLLEYLVKSINTALKALFKSDEIGELAVNIKEIDYDHLWEEYSLGNMTLTDLSNSLFD